MSASTTLGFLRPSLVRSGSKITSSFAAYIQFYDAVRSYSRLTARPGGLDQMTRVKDSIADYVNPTSRSEVTTREEDLDIEAQREDVRRRIRELEAARALNYPRIGKRDDVMTCKEYRESFDSLENEESRDNVTVTLRGRVYSTRSSGSKLVFIDLVQDGFKVQGLCNLGRLEATSEQFKQFHHLLKRGDTIAITGSPYKTKRGEISIRAAQIPVILTPGLASLPTTLEDRETLVKSRHADMLVHRQTIDTLKLRSQVIQSLRGFLLSDQFLEVQTPIMARSAGGAVARPFITHATEFPEKPLSLRIAPEIWLKRLIIGGMDRVFEIGPVFRNEGVDGTHNPEFYTCEFYKAFANLEDLMVMTEKMIGKMVEKANHTISSNLTSLTPLNSNEFSGPFNRLEFIPSIESAISQKLPDLSSSTAQEDVKALFTRLSLPLPISPTLPRLLDKLSSHYIEPLCTSPTYITHHPSCLAPLAKAFTCPQTQQLVSARAELFVKHREIANMYEEENDPREQRRKFVEQKMWVDEENAGEVDEGYIEAMEWGLPPTGGWGMGLDRLVMLFSGRERIGDVLSFGTLRNVVGLGREKK